MGYAPHILGIDDGPFSISKDEVVPLVGVLTQASTPLEGVAVNQFPVDGKEATQFYSRWIRSMRWYESIQAVMINGITVAGLGVININRLSSLLSLPVLSMTRHATNDEELREALTTAGYTERISILDQIPPSHQYQEGIYLAVAGVDKGRADKILTASLEKARMPEPVRIAHLIATAIKKGESKGNA